MCGLAAFPIRYIRVEGPNTWEATSGHGPGDVRVDWRAMRDGLVAWGDWLVQSTSGKGLVTFSGSTPGLVARTSADPRTLRKVTSESVDNSSVEASVTGHWVSGTMPKASKAAAASRSRSSRLNLAIAVAEVSLDRNLFASPGSEVELAINPVASMESVVRDVSLKYWSAIRQSDERQNADVPVLWRSVDATNDTGRPTMAGRVNSRNVGRHQKVLQL